MNRIHPTAIIGPDVTLGSGNSIGPYTVIEGKVAIGDDNWIGPHVTIGLPGEVRGAVHETPCGVSDAEFGVTVGSRNVIREFTAIHSGTRRVTFVGDDCYVMNKAYVAHDCVLGDRATLSGGVLLAGFVVLGADVNLGLGTCVHQHRVVGAGAMLGMGSIVTRDVPPHALAFGAPARTQRANEVGLRRRGAAEETITAIDAALREGDLEALRRLAPAEMTLFDTAIAANATPGSKSPADLLVSRADMARTAPELVSTQS